MANRPCAPFFNWGILADLYMGGHAHLGEAAINKTITILISLGFGVLIAATSHGAEKRDTQHGIYHSVPLKFNEYDLLKTAHDYEDMMSRRGLRFIDPQLESWFAGIGQRLTPNPSDEYQHYRFYLLRDPSPNAFALPDGQIYVHTGLLARLENEAQLAALLAHEINHVAGHHSLVAYRSRQSKAMLGVFVGLLGEAVGTLGAAGGALLINSGLAASVYGYSRSLEKEADIRGYDLLLNAGYDVREIPNLYGVLGQDYEGLQPRIRGKWSTHPELQIRAEYMADLVAKAPVDILAGLEIGDADFRKRIRPLALTVVDDYILDDYPKTALELARTLVEEDPNDPNGRVAVGNACIALGKRPGYSTDHALSDKKKKKAAKNRARLTRAELRAQAEALPDAMANLEKNSEAAEQAFLAALELDPNRSEAYRGLGRAYLNRNQYKQSAAAFMRYLKMEPEASDRPVIIDQLHEIMRKIRSG